ncbi:MAG: LytTR family transcriptional regulator DNA-binding domain-containing protein [Xanthomonadales bacterium]|nr:LytTR family transcriptional regulator DNA-binding domain-containing protein [Xanthomonadales bacterium]
MSVDRIVRIQGAGDYVELHLDDGSRLLHTATLNDLDAELAPAFLRVHRSHLVNTRRIERLDRSDACTGTLHLRGSDPVPVSRRVMPGVRRALR